MAARPDAEAGPAEAKRNLTARGAGPFKARASFTSHCICYICK